MTGTYSHLFDAQAAAYAEYRPNYPAELYQEIYRYANFEGKPNTALDIATGSGQAAVELAKTFTKVLAIDSNEQQLNEAKNKAVENVEYRQGLAEETGAAPSSIDMISVAQALHWFDLSRFFQEAARVLKPGGTLAAWGYGLPEIRGNQKATELLVEFAYGSKALGPYWAQRRRLIDEEYASIVPDKGLFTEPVRRKIHTSTECSINFFIGYLSSWSSYSTYRQRHPDKEDPLVPFKQQLKELMGTQDSGLQLTIDWTIFILLTKANA